MNQPLFSSAALLELLMKRIFPLYRILRVLSLISARTNLLVFWFAKPIPKYAHWAIGTFYVA